MQITDLHINALKFFIKKADDYLITQNNKENHSIEEMQKYTQVLLSKTALMDLLKGIERELENMYENLKSNKDKRMIKKLIIKIKEWLEDDN